MAAPISRQKAKVYSGISVGMLIGGVVAAGYALSAARAPDPRESLDTTLAISGHPKPSESSSARPSPETPRRDFDGRGASARLALIKNRPVAVDTPSEETTPEETTTPPESTEPIKYLGPVKMGSLTMALVSIEDKQRPVIKGKTFASTADGSTRNFRLVSVDDESIVVEEEGKERTIAKAVADGDVVSYLGARPARGKSVVMSKKSKAPSKNPGENPLAEAGSDARAKIMDQYGSMIRATIKAKGEMPRDLRDKLTDVMKSQGIDPGEIDGIIKETMAEMSK